MTSVTRRGGDEARQAHGDKHMRTWGEGGGLHARREASGGTSAAHAWTKAAGPPGRGGSLRVLFPPPSFWLLLRQAEQTSTACEDSLRPGLGDAGSQDLSTRSLGIRRASQSPVQAGEPGEVRESFPPAW